MSFKLPKLLPPRKRAAGIVEKRDLTDGLPLSSPSEIKRIKTIGRGSYGHISLCELKKRKLVLKELIVEDEASKRLFIKEARVLHMLNHENIVKFDSVCDTNDTGNVGFLMEYVYFDFKPFGQDFVACSLKDLLKFVDNYDSEGFEHLQKFIATDVCGGLAYLHKNNIAHRDLKPENVLVSNQHYCCSESTDLSTLWFKKPVIAKLTDFGESRARLVQTGSFIHTRTSNVYRGTPAYMAPEIFLHDGRTQMNLNDLKRMDIWSYSMILFALLNPDLRYPYQLEYANETKCDNPRPATEVLKDLFYKQQLPIQSLKYENQRRTHWVETVQVYNLCAKFDIRPDIENILSFLKKIPDRRERNLFSDLLNLNKADYVTDSESNENEITVEVNLTETERKEQSCSNTDVKSKPLMNSEIKRDDLVIENKESQEMYFELSSNTKSTENSGRNTESVTESNNENNNIVAENNQEAQYDMPTKESQKIPYKKDSSQDCIGEEMFKAGQTSNVDDILDSHSSQILSNKYLTSEQEVSSVQTIPLATMNKTNISCNLVDDMMSCVSGHFHQATPEVFNHAAVGTQCSTISVISVIVSSIKSKDDWNPNDIDNILKQGDILHLKILKERGWPYSRSDSRLDLDELPSVISCQIESLKVTASVGVTNEVIYGFAMNIENLIMSALHEKPGQSFVLRMFDSCTSIIYGSNGRYSIFDPHARNSSGLIDPKGKACILHFDRASDMITYLKSLVADKENQQIDLSPINVEVLMTETLDMNEISSHLRENDSTFRSMSSTTGSRTHCPVYTERQKGLDVKEIISLCQFDTVDEIKVCKRVPPPRTNAVYVLDLSCINVKDISCDDSGIYTTHSSPSAVVRATLKQGKVIGCTILSRKKVDIGDPILDEENIYQVKRLYSEHHREGVGKATRIISKVYAKNKLAKFAIVQYIGERQCHLRAHGNAKKQQQQIYIRTKPSVLEKESELARKVAPKQVINLIDKESGGPYCYNSVSDGPRDRQQIYNVKKNHGINFKVRNTGKVVAPDFSKLIASMDNGDFLKNIDFSNRDKFHRIHPNTFAATDNTLTWIKQFCIPGAEWKSQLGIDMTYKVGPFYTTCMSFQHPMFVYKDDPQKHPTLLACMMTSTGRQKEDYLYLASQLKSRGIETLIYGTDGEFALELGMEAVFPIESVPPGLKSIKLRCFNHVKDDLLAELKKINVSDLNSITTSILGTEYENRRLPGLVDCETSEYEKEYETLSRKWPSEFQHYMLSTRLKIRPLKETLLKCMGKDARIAAGLGNPPNKYDNQRAEAINSVLKESIGSDFVDQSAVHDLVYENVIKPQELELVKAIYSHGEYRLAPRFKHFEICPLQWKTMSEDQRINHASRVLKCKTKMANQNTPMITKKLTIQPQDCKDSLSELPLRLIQEVWDGAEIILSHFQVTTMQNGSHCIIEDNDVFIVTEAKEDEFKCNCARFIKINICSHVLVIADNRNCLPVLLQRYKYSPSTAIHRHKPSSSGEKRVKKPRKGQQNITKRPIQIDISINEQSVREIDLKSRRPFQYSEIWHNDEPFYLVNIHDLQDSKKNISCASCSCTITKRNAVSPFDIIFCHQERYKYPKRDDNGKIQWIPTHKKTGAKYYCLKQECLLSRHPYFWVGLINTERVYLQETHRKFLQDAFGYS